MKRLLLGVDIGSTNIKAILCTPDGEVEAVAGEELGEQYPCEGWVEQEPSAIWAGVVRVVNKVTRGVAPDRIAGMAMDSNRCALLLADGAGEPITNLMTWRDSRSLPYVDSFVRENPGLDLCRITGEEGLPQHSLFKALWCKGERPELWDSCERLFLSPVDYLLFRMLGRHVTSRSIAQSSALFDIHALRYSREILDAAGIDEGLLPSPLDSHDRLGCLEGEVADQLGLPRGLPVICGLCDATASQLGSGAVARGIFAVSIGTCGAVRTFAAHPARTQSRFAQIRVLSPFGYVPSCTVNDAGNVLKWYRNEFCGGLSAKARDRGVSVYRLMDEAAAGVPPGCGGLILLPYLTGSGYAVKDADACGVFAGIRSHHTHAHFSRAILEGVAFSLRSVLEGFRREGYPVEQIRVSGGGVSSSLWMQILADVLGVSIHTLACGEASAMGSAMMAAVGLGIHGGIGEAAQHMVREGCRYEPDLDRVRVYERVYATFCRLMERMQGIGIAPVIPSGAKEGTL